MISFSKEFLYDWLGLNVWLFRQINGIHHDIYDSAMVLLSQTASYRNFPYYMAALLGCAIISTLVRKLRGHAGMKLYVTAWFGAFLVLGAGYVAEVVSVHVLKGYFSYPRPYIVLEEKEVRVLDYNAMKPGDDHRSFPSGHAAFVTLMVAGLWPMIPAGMGWLGMVLVGGVCWSRIAVGAHFPADVLAGVLISLVLVVLLRGIIYSLLFLLFKVKC